MGVVRTLSLSLALLLAGCEGEIRGDSRDAGPAAAADATSGPGDAGGVDSGTAAIDAGSCGPTLAASLSLTPIPGVSMSGVLVAPDASGGLALAWRDGGAVTLQRVDGAGAPIASAITLAGDGVWGVAAASDALAVLVSRDDELVLVVRALDGGAIGETRLMGAVSHDEIGNEWFGPLVRAARLDWDGAQWIAYATVQRLWDDGVAHYGDTLRTFARDGAPASVVWGWGCSHSIEVRLAHDAAGVGAVCSSDCYPDKGVFFMHDTLVFADSSGNCAGSVQQRLGGIASVAGAFIVGWTSAEGRMSADPAVARVADDRSVAAPTWLSDAAGDDRELHVGSYASGAVALWIGADGAGRAVRIAASSALDGAAEPIDAAAIDGASDIVRLSDGDTAWIVGGRLARLRACE